MINPIIIATKRPKSFIIDPNQFPIIPEIQENTMSDMHPSLVVSSLNVVSRNCDKCKYFIRTDSGDHCKSGQNVFSDDICKYYWEKKRQ